MSKDKTKKSYSHYKNLQHDIDKAREKRDELNQKTKKYIKNLQGVEEKIKSILDVAKKYKKTRNRCNKRVAKIKEKKIEYKNLLHELIDKSNTLRRQRDKKKGKFISTKNIDKKIENLERIIETENLELSEENQIVDEIRKLAEKKQEVVAEDNYDEIMKHEKKIEIIKINLDKIYEKISKWSNRSQKYHNKMLETYDQVNKLKDKKRQIEERLIANKKEADKYHEKFLELMKLRKKNWSRGSGRGRGRSYQKSSYKKRKAKNKKLDKIKEIKLKEALEKQKAGKKLNLYEARLILEKTKD
jgi:uncharacterized coiled-coil DUF342 family protein